VRKENDKRKQEKRNKERKMTKDRIKERERNRGREKGKRKISEGHAFAVKNWKKTGEELDKGQEDKKKEDRMMQENEEKGFRKGDKRREIKRQKDGKR
jgi:hypothetical protein